MSEANDFWLGSRAHVRTLETHAFLILQDCQVILSKFSFCFMVIEIEGNQNSPERGPGRHFLQNFKIKTLNSL